MEFVLLQLRDLTLDCSGTDLGVEVYLWLSASRGGCGGIVHDIPKRGGFKRGPRGI